MKSAAGVMWCLKLNVRNKVQTHPRWPTDSPLWKVLHNYYEAFKAGYDEHCEKQYGSFRPLVDGVVEEYLRCGDLHEGFARVRCTNPDCRHEHLLAFSCKGRWFCPSCHHPPLSPLEGGLRGVFSSGRTCPTTSFTPSRIGNLSL
jgi:hypothetical protein